MESSEYVIHIFKYINVKFQLIQDPDSIYNYTLISIFPIVFFSHLG